MLYATLGLNRVNNLIDLLCVHLQGLALGLLQDAPVTFLQTAGLVACRRDILSVIKL